MSLIIHNIDLHYLSKAENDPTVTLKASAGPIEVTPKMEGFVESLHNIYNSKASKAFGGFKTEPMDGFEKPFDHLLEDYLQNEADFIPFSNQASMRLKTELEKYELAETGYLVTCHYEMLGGKYLIVALLPITEHYFVDGELNISADQHIDTSKVQLAARIDLFAYRDNKEAGRYISFIKGRAGRKVSDFFLDFLNCEEGVNPKQQSEVLVQAVEDFVSVNQLNADEKQTTRKELLSYCKEQQQTGKEVDLKELSQAIPHEENGEEFFNFCKANDYEIEESFPHDQTVINKVTKYSGYGAGISVSFERSHFGTDVTYNPVKGSLTIHKVPPNLKDQLMKLLASEETED
ncbi:nucleoid-associated protein YejK [Thalassomonas sp. M1454]|uniref:nucleoid-associated protein YejK n=1 Tax=Thalassomonas sp. M1454 TaxID=2594477 RepID=UPI00117F9627|nr:nucleoid-associated protein YejK [Thalassomonas sp. M1454]TRX56867.1 nucleoid-associated protein YejK [Thalassomonas sp. M1454]